MNSKKTVVRVGTVEEHSEVPQPTGRRKTVQVGIAGEQAGMGG